MNKVKKIQIERPIQINIPLDELVDYIKDHEDFTEVVRCKNCTLATKDYVSECFRECRLDVLNPRLVRDEHFCCLGVRRNEDD